MTAPTIHICPVCGEDDGLDEQECRRCGARLWDNDEDDRPPYFRVHVLEGAASGLAGVPVSDPAGQDVDVEVVPRERPFFIRCRKAARACRTATALS